MKRVILSFIVMLAFAANIQAKDLVVYFSATGNTQAVAEQISNLIGADLLRIEAAEPYASDPYDDSDRIQGEAYNDLRPGVTNLPTAETIAQYDRIFVGSPIWWHQPAMVVCTFLEAFDLSDKIIIPFFTYGATTYLNESMHKIYKSTPNSRHIPETLPEDLNPDDITTPGPADDSGIDMPGNARGVEAWLTRLGLLGNETSITDVQKGGAVLFELHHNGNTVEVNLADNISDNAFRVYASNGSLVYHNENHRSYSFQLPYGSQYLLSVIDKRENRTYSRKIAF